MGPGSSPQSSASKPASDAAFVSWCSIAGELGEQECRGLAASPAGPCQGHHHIGQLLAVWRRPATEACRQPVQVCYALILCTSPGRFKIPVPCPCPVNLCSQPMQSSCAPFLADSNSLCRVPVQSSYAVNPCSLPVHLSWPTQISCALSLCSRPVHLC